MRKVALVTGAAGFIGRHVSRYLSKQGWQVLGMGHGAAPAVEWGLAEWRQDSINEDALARLHSVPTLVVHCAGSGSVAASIADPESDRRKTVESTHALLEYIRHRAPQAVFVYPSSAAVYGLCEPSPICENHVLQPVSPYGHHKLAAERLISTYATDYHLKVAIVRLFSVYGPGLKKQLLWDACQRLLNGEKLFFGTGDETRDWLHVEDAAALLARAAEFASERCPVVNGGSGISASNREVLQLLANALGDVPTPEFNLQTRPGDPLHYHADIRAAEAWGWQPHIAWASGMSDYVGWFQRGAQ